VGDLEISFTGKELGESTQLARELRDRLRSEGIPDETMTIARDRADTMDLGSALQLLELAEHIVVPATLAIHVATIAHTVYELCFREHCGLKVKIANRVVELGPGEIDIEKLRAVLNEAANVAGTR
jgi:hypothetical protein